MECEVPIEAYKNVCCDRLIGLATRARPCERELANRYVAGRHRHHLVPDDLRKPASAKTVNPPAHDGLRRVRRLRCFRSAHCVWCPLIQRSDICSAEESAGVTVAGSGGGSKGYVAVGGSPQSNTWNDCR
jgi:hypothetical protein